MTRALLQPGDEFQSQGKGHWWGPAPTFPTGPQCEPKGIVPESPAQVPGTANSQWEPGLGPLLRQFHSGLSAPGSQQQADPVFLLPLCFLEGAEGHLGGFPENIFHVLPKLGRTFQIECSLHLFTDTQALEGRRRQH